MPLHRRVPKRGFTNIFKSAYDIINVGALQKTARVELGPIELAAEKLVRRGARVKVLGDGELTRPVKIRAHKFSEAAIEKIKAAGGSWEVITA